MGTGTIEPIVALSFHEETGPYKRFFILTQVALRVESQERVVGSNTVGIFVFLDGAEGIFHQAGVEGATAVHADHFGLFVGFEELGVN